MKETSSDNGEPSTDKSDNRSGNGTNSGLGNIQVVVRSGEKYQTEHGTRAIKDGVKNHKSDVASGTGKPSWLRAKIPGGGKYEAVRDNVRQHKLATVCEESKCPNIGECWTCLLYTSPSPRDRG